MKRSRTCLKGGGGERGLGEEYGPLEDEEKYLASQGQVPPDEKKTREAKEKKHRD